RTGARRGAPRTPRAARSGCGTGPSDSSRARGAGPRRTASPRWCSGVGRGPGASTRRAPGPCPSRGRRAPAARSQRARRGAGPPAGSASGRRARARAARRRRGARRPCPGSARAGRARAGGPAPRTRASRRSAPAGRRGPGSAPRASARRELAPPARRPPARREPEPGYVLARLDLFVGAQVAGAPNAPAPLLLRVLVTIEGGAADRDLPLRLDHDVLERPDAGRGVGSGELDLGMVDPVARVETLCAHRAAQEVEDGRTPGGGVLAAAVLGDGVLGEALLHLVPELLVETAHVLVLEPLDGLDLDQVFGRHAFLLATGEPSVRRTLLSIQLRTSMWRSAGSSTSRAPARRQGRAAREASPCRASASSAHAAADASSRKVPWATSPLARARARR